jgi:Septum formation
MEGEGVDGVPGERPAWGSPPEPVEPSSTVPPWGSPEGQPVPPWGTPPTADAPPRRTFRSVLRSTTTWWLLGAAAVIGGSIAMDARGMSSPGDSRPAGASDTSTVTLDELKVGECLRVSDADNLPDDIPLVPCAQAHQLEVFGVFDLPEGAWPGDDSVEAAADQRCTPLFTSYVGASADDPKYTWSYYLPSKEDWSDDVRRVVCTDETFPGSSTSIKRADVSGQP